MGVKTIGAGLVHLDVLTGLFDAYRQFYGQEPDLLGARRFLEARLRGGDSVVLLAFDATGAGVGFVQLYPSFSSVAMKPIWILNDLFVAPEARRNAGLTECGLGDTDSSQPHGNQGSPPKPLLRPGGEGADDLLHHGKGDAPERAIARRVPRAEVRASCGMVPSLLASRFSRRFTRKINPK